MNIKIILSAVIVISVVLATGCQFAYDFWPAEVSPLAVKFAGRDANSIKWYEKNLHTAKELKNEVIDVYIGQQLRLDYLANLNKEKYQQVLGILDLSIKQAQADRQAAIGTLDEPGWLLAGLMTLLPIGSYIAGWRTFWPSHYTEQEVKAEIEKSKKENSASV